MKRQISHQPLLTAALLLTLAIGGSGAAHAFKGVGSRQVNPGGAGIGSSDQQEVKILGHEADTEMVVVLVNGTKITMGRLVSSMMEVIKLGGYSGDDLTKEMAANIRKQAMEKLALEELAYQRAASLGITVTPAMIQAKLDAVIAAQGGREALDKNLAKQKKSLNDLKNEISRFLAVKEAIRREVDGKVVVTDAEIKQTYEANKARFVIPEKTVVTDIIFFLAPDDPAAKEKVLAIRRRISDDPGKNPAKLTPDGFTVQSQLNVSPENRPEQYRIARTMVPGSLSEPVVIDGTLHLLKLDLYQPPRDTPEAKAKASIAKKLKAGKREQLLTDWRTSLLKDADIKVVNEMMRGDDAAK